MAVGPSWPHGRGKYRPVSNKAAALLPPWRHPGTGASTILPGFMTVGQDVDVLSVAGRGLLQCDVKMQTHEFLVWQGEE